MKKKKDHIFYKSVDEVSNYVMTKGLIYKAALLPAEIPRLKLHHCFDNCVILALRFPKYKYVEGFALNPISGQYIAHAWLTDGVHAFDPTWAAFDGNNVEHPMPSIYIGIEMTIEDVVAFMRKTKFQSILANYWRDPELAIKCIEKPLLTMDRLEKMWDSGMKVCTGDPTTCSCFHCQDKKIKDG